jgi:hypothetical protein
MSFVRGPNPIWTEFNLTGAIFDDTYYAFFLTNVLPYTFQAVYQTPNGISWSNPIEFSASGGLPNNLYFDPTLVYRIEFRQGPNDTFPLIGNPIENYVPGSSGGSSVVVDSLFTAQNLITNPQFSDVNFNSTITFTTAGTYDIAPGWQLLLAGTGTATVTQTPNPGFPATTGNPPYFLTIATSGGWTNVQLIQTFVNNGAIFAGGAIGLTFTAEAQGATYPLTVEYNPSGTSNFQDIFSGVIATGSFISYGAAIDLNSSVNTNTGFAANVQIIFQLQNAGTISLTNVQITGQSTPLVNATLIPSFNEQTYEQIVNNEFHIYRNSLVRQAKDTILVGWDFPLNPWQFTTTAITNVAVNQYTADQTIVIQQNYVTNAVGNNIAVGQASLTNDKGFQATAVTATNQFGILQYLEFQSTLPYWGQPLSSLIIAQLVSTKSPITPVKIKMRLIYLNNTPTATSQNYPVLSWTDGGDPVFAAGITAITPPNDPAYTLTNALQQFPFDGMVLPQLVATPQTLGIFVYTVGDMNSVATADSIIFKDISLVPNQFAIASNPKTADQVLRECQYYWEQSYNVGTLPSGTNVGMETATKELVVTGPAGGIFTATLYGKTIEVDFKQTKRSIPAVTFYSPDSTINTIMGTIYINGSATSGDIGIGSWTAINSSTDNLIIAPTGTGAYFQATGTSAFVGWEGAFRWQYTANSRLG